MSLRHVSVTISREGRDKGKTFLLTEMPSDRAEDWFLRAMMLLGRSGTDVPPDIFNHGAMAFATIGISTAIAGLGKSPWAELKPLLDEMMTCVGYQTPNGAIINTISQVSAQIEEVATRIQLREEVLSLHLGFSITAKLSALRALAGAMMATLPNTETSQGSSEQLSPAV